MAAVPTQDSNWVRIIIEDSVIGIQQESVQKLFPTETELECEEKQATNSAKVGPDLNIASNLANLLAPKSHPGINVSSIFNKGSVFSFIKENKQDINSEKFQDLDESTFWYEIAEEIPGIIQHFFEA